MASESALRPLPVAHSAPRSGGGWLDAQRLGPTTACDGPEHHGHQVAGHLGIRSFPPDDQQRLDVDRIAGLAKASHTWTRAGPNRWRLARSPHDDCRYRTVRRLSGSSLAGIGRAPSDALRCARFHSVAMPSWPSEPVTSPIMSYPGESRCLPPISMISPSMSTIFNPSTCLVSRLLDAVRAFPVHGRSCRERAGDWLDDRARKKKPGLYASLSRCWYGRPGRGPHD